MTITRNLFTFIFMVKMVVVCYLFTRIYISFSKKDHLHACIKHILPVKLPPFLGHFWQICSDWRYRKKGAITFFTFLTEIISATQFGWPSIIQCRKKVSHDGGNPYSTKIFHGLYDRCLRKMSLQF